MPNRKLSTSELVMLLHGPGEEGLIAHYRELKKELQGKRGELVLLSYRSRCAGIARYRVAVLLDEELGYEAPNPFGETMWLASKRFIGAEVAQKTPPLKLWQYHIFAPVHDRAEAPPPFEEMMGGKDGWHESIIVGNDAVRRWLEARGLGGYYQPFLHALAGEGVPKTHAAA